MSDDYGDIQPGTPSSAGFWNVLQGGKDGSAADVHLAEHVLAHYPVVADLARASRAFLARVVHHLAAEKGVRQFLDVGTGLPTDDNTHEIAQRAAPDARIVYVDNDPRILAHARARLTSSTPQGATAYVDADMSDHATVLREAARTLDLGQPVALLFLSVLGHLDPAASASLVSAYTQRLAPGSYLAVCDTVTGAGTPQGEAAYTATGAAPYTARTPEQLAATAGGLEILPPGIGPITRWHADGPPLDQHGYLARKP
ncbi:SAM-dependent methyltransferase [Streptomyces sp. TRM70308]|uniref:SAM-dependent methyltransferase n=1 Tax=Streptomyces sp. TRM70308 TaxID=3131932 RepID=UPI003D02A35F